MKSTSKFRLLPKIYHFLFFLLFITSLLLGTQMLNLDGDLPRHLLMGRYILQNHSIPTTEIFIYPYLHKPYIPHEWLTDVLFHIIYSFAGWAGLVIFSAFLLAATFTLLYQGLSERLDLRLPVLLLILWGATATSLNWAIRPHLVSMFLLVPWLFWANDLAKGKKLPIWLFPLVMLVWSNLHGEFIAGILVLCAYAFGWLVEYLVHLHPASLTIGKDIWLALLLSALTSLLNPSGAGPWLSIFGFVNNEYLMSRMVEANAPNFQNPDMQILFSLIVGSLFLLAVKKNSLLAGQGFLLAGFSALSLMAIRNIHLYGIVAPFVLAETLLESSDFPALAKIEIALKQIESRSKGLSWAPALFIALGIGIVANRILPGSYQLQEPNFPVRAVTWLKDHPQQGNMFNNLNWGGYLGLNLWPSQMPFIDSMSDTTGEVTREYETVVTLQEGWQEIFEVYDITWAILPPDWPLVQELMSEGWHTGYQDQAAIILLKK